MPYIGEGSKTESSNFILLDDISTEFNGQKRTFTMTSEGSGAIAHSSGSTFISIDGILLHPGVDYNLNSDLSSITFTEAPIFGANFKGRIVQTSGITIPDGSITSDKLSRNLVRPSRQTLNIPVGNTSRSFTLNEIVENEDDVSVYVDGLYQRPTVNYTVEGTQITFDEIPNSNMEIDILYHVVKSVHTTTDVKDGERSLCNVKTSVDDLKTCVENLNADVNQSVTSKAGGIQWIFNEVMMDNQQCAAGPCWGNSNCDCAIANGRCCQWTVPANVCCVVFEIWGGGGGGAGMNCCNCCSFGLPGGGGNYAMKSIQTKPGCQYTICAGGTYPCCHHHGCVSGPGCPSYVVGHNLANFCVMGGCAGIVCNGDKHGNRTAQICANNPDGNNPCISFGADFSIAGSTSTNTNSSTCHCSKRIQIGGTAPMIGVFGTKQTVVYWCHCACFVPGFGAGGLSGDTTYCGNNCKCCAAGNMGGPGLVRITYF